MNILHLLSIAVISLAYPNDNTQHFNNLNKFPKSKKIMAKLTAYHNHEDIFGAKVAMSSSMRAKQGYTVAAHHDFAFGKKLFIPALKGVLNKDGIFEVEDRGRDIESKKASKGKCYVFDIFMYGKNAKDGNRKIKELTKNIPQIQEVYILN